MAVEEEEAASAVVAAAEAAEEETEEDPEVADPPCNSVKVRGSRCCERANSTNTCEAR